MGMNKGEIMNYKKKRITISKIVLFIPYLMSAFLLYLIWFIIIKNMSYAFITAIASVLVTDLGVCGYVTKWYLKKAALENEPKVRLGIMQDLFNFQQQHPDFNVYDKIQIRQDAQNIVNPIKVDEQKQYETMTTDNVDQKIN